MCNALIDKLQNDQTNQQKVNELYAELCKSLFQEIDNNIEYKLVNSNRSKKKFKISKPYWDVELTNLWKDMNSKERLFLKNKDYSKQKTNKHRETFKSAQQLFDKTLRKKSRQYNYQKINSIEGACLKNPKEFWGNIKKLGPNKSTNIPLKIRTSDDEETTNIDAVLNGWQSDFSNLLNPQTDSVNFDDNFLKTKTAEKETIEANIINNEYNINDAINLEFTQEELDKVILQLKSQKSCGIDLIKNEIIKCTGLHTLLLVLFRHCFTNGMIPSIWQTGNIIPIPKGAGKDPLVPLNYRGITLISCISKVYSALINKRIVQYCNEMNIFAEEQNGFRPKRSCEDHVFSLSSVIQNRLNNEKDTFCAFIDLEKAFDWLNRDLLLYKLLSININGNMYFAIKSLLQNTKSKVSLSETVSTSLFDVMCGVRQGDPLSPTLFSLFINDLVDDLKQTGTTLCVGNVNFNTLLYVDDMVIIGETEIDLQLLLNALNDWCFKWRVKINQQKSKIIHFRKLNSKQTEIDFKFNKVIL